MNIHLRLIRHLSVLVASGSGVYLLYNELYCSESKKSKLELKINDKAVPVPPKLRNLITEVMDDMKMNEKNRSAITPFINKAADLVHLGFTENQNKGYLGVPFYFNVEETDNVAFTVWVDKVQVPKSTVEAQSVKQSVLLSKEAKKFAIARELYLLLNSTTGINAVLPAFVIFNYSLLSYSIEKLNRRTIKQSVKVHISLFFAAILLVIFLHDIISAYSETEADFLACELGESYLQGAIEYYEKMLEKNKEVKKLNQNTPFTIDGDLESPFLRKPHIPIKNRLMYLNDLIYKKEKKPSVWSSIFLSYKF